MHKFLNVFTILVSQQVTRVINLKYFCKIKGNVLLFFTLSILDVDDQNQFVIMHCSLQMLINEVREFFY